MSNDVLAQLMLSDLLKTGGKNIANISAIGKLLQTPDSGSTLTTAQQKNHDAISSALAALDTDESNLSYSGGAKGPIMGGDWTDSSYWTTIKSCRTCVPV